MEEEVTKGEEVVIIVEGQIGFFRAENALAGLCEFLDGSFNTGIVLV